MPAKRGRPLSSESSDPAVQRRRELGRAREKRRYDRQQAARAADGNALSLPQLQQGERVVDLSTSAEEEAAVTLTQLGLRVQDVTLAQDSQDARLQQDSLPIEEHDTLYQTVTKTASRRPEGFFRQFAARPAPVLHGQQDLSTYYRTLPANNPFMSNSHPTLSPVPEVGSLANDYQGALDDEDVAVTFENSDNMTDGLPGGVSPGPMLANNAERSNIEDAHTLAQEDVEGLVENVPVATERTTDSDTAIQAPIACTANEDTIMNDQESASGDRASSPLGFAQEHTVELEEAGEDEQIAAHEHVVEKLFEQLQGGFHGCTRDEHDEKHQDHMNALGDDHHSLGEIFNDRSFPSVLGLPEMITADRLSRQQMPTPSQWEAMFCGIPLGSRETIPRPKHVCLHNEQTQAVDPKVAYDIDSFLGFGSSLAMARQGLWYQPAPQMRQNITADNHLKTSHFKSSPDPDAAERVSTVMVRDVPHFLLGRVVGAHDITVHVLFPHIPVLGDKFKSLTTEQLSRWSDQVFHPSVYKYCEAHYTQHLPASYGHAYANSKAHQVEGRQIETASYQAQQAIGYHLQPEYLGEIWQDIIDKIDQTPGLADFREPQLFFSAKGTKLQFKTSPSRPTLLDAMENFASYLERVVDLDFVQLERLYIDVGKEICNRVSRWPRQQGHIGDEAHVYMWKRCCLSKYMDWMYDGNPPPLGHGQMYYEQCMLYDACSLTSVTPKRSQLREGGLIYSQFYGSVKEISDATKCKPFDNDGLEELALDPQILKGARNAAGGHRRDASIIENAYRASKCRAKIALTDSRGKSFGIREEHRITWELFQGLRYRLEEEDRRSLEVVLEDCPTYAWAIKTEKYLDFLWRSADKFATGFEVVRARCRQDLITWEQTKIMAMFLRCLRFVFGGHQLRRESALWWSRRERTVDETGRLKVWIGLGFCNTLERYGYAWIEPRIDWTGLRFKPDITDYALFGNAVLRGQYLRRGGQVQAFFDLTRRTDLALDWLEQYLDNERVRDRLLMWTIHICLEQFRKDVLTSIKHEIRTEYHGDALSGKHGFCKEYFEEIMEGDVHLVAGNRSDFKQVQELGAYLFGFDDGILRKHWDAKPYRKLHQRVLAGLLLLEDGRNVQKTFQRRLFRKLYEYHWILPYPTPEVFLQTTKQGHRMWYSIIFDRNADQRVWKWGRKGWEQGRPGSPPDWVDWSKDQWEQWLPRRRV